MSDWTIVDGASTFDLYTNLSFRVKQIMGAGMPPVDNIAKPFGLLDGSIFQRQRTTERQFTLVGTLAGSSISGLHANRSRLIDRIKPDRSASQQPVILRYAGASTTKQASAYYDSGLELSNTTARIESQIALRFVQFDPYWEATTSSSAALTTQASFTANYIVQRAACGAWGGMNSGTNASVHGVVSGSDGTYYAVGSFDKVNGTSTVASRVAQYSGGAWTALGNGTNNKTYAITLGRGDGYVYVAGEFTQASNVAACGVARWTGAGWTSMASGIGRNGTGWIGYSIKADNSGDILVGGVFNQLGGGAGSLAASGFAKWVVSTSAWSVVASGLRELSLAGYAQIQEIGVDAYNNYWVSGVFDAAGLTTNTACNTAYYSQSASNWLTVNGSGFVTQTGGTSAPPAYGLDIGSDGNIYIGGYGIGNSGQGLWYTNGVGLYKIITASYSSGLYGVYRVRHDPLSNAIYLGGLWSTLNGQSIPNFARYIGGAVTPADITPPGTVSINDIYAASNGELTLGFNSSGTACAAAVTTVTNSGTALTYPILTASAPTSSSAAVIQLVNYTTGDQIYFNLSLAPREIVTLDLRPGKKTLTSNFRGNIISSILPGSNVATWRLIPGANNVSFWLTGGGGAAALTWTNRFWGIDG